MTAMLTANPTQFSCKSFASTHVFLDRRIGGMDAIALYLASRKGEGMKAWGKCVGRPLKRLRISKFPSRPMAAHGIVKPPISRLTSAPIWTAECDRPRVRVNTLLLAPDRNGHDAPNNSPSFRGQYFQVCAWIICTGRSRYLRIQVVWECHGWKSEFIGVCRMIHSQCKQEALGVLLPVSNFFDQSSPLFSI